DGHHLAQRRRAMISTRPRAAWRRFFTLVRSPRRDASSTAVATNGTAESLRGISEMPAINTDIPFSTFSGYLKNMRPERFDEQAKYAMKWAFAHFYNDPKKNE